MKEILINIMNSYKMFFGMGIYQTLFIISIVYLVVKEKKKDIKQFFLGLLVIFAIIYICPVSAYVIMYYCIGVNVYWRMLWILPVTVMIAYMITKEIASIEIKWKRVLSILGVVLAFVLGGSSIYSINFSERTNGYKLYAEVIEICDAIETDAKEKSIQDKGLIAVNELVSQIRQYDASIRMPYGRNALKGEKLGKLPRKIYYSIYGDKLNAEALAFYAKQGEYQYLAYYAQEDIISVFENAGYEWLKQVGGYYIFRLKSEQISDIFITQYGWNDGNQIMFYTIETMKGKLIVIDGGYEVDEEYVRRIIYQKGNRVDAWILTHFHPDHIGAFCKIYENPQNINIKKIYTVDMAPLELCVENAPWDETYTYERFMELDVKVTKYLRAGKRVKIAGVPMRIFNAYDDYVDELSNDLHNDGSIMFMVYGETERMLFCSDVGKSMSDYLLEKYGKKLKADYLQMGHHGNGGLKADFYQMVNPKMAFFDAPAWLFDNTDGTYTSAENRRIMEELGAEIMSFEGAPHSVQLQ